MVEIILRKDMQEYEARPLFGFTYRQVLTGALIVAAATAIGVSYRHAWRLFQELLQDGTLEKEGRAYRIANTRQLLRLASLTG